MEMMVRSCILPLVSVTSLAGCPDFASLGGRSGAGADAPIHQAQPDASASTDADSHSPEAGGPDAPDVAGPGPFHWGTVRTGFFNGQTRSALAHIDFPTECASTGVAIVAQSRETKI